MVAAMTLIALADILEALEDILAELDMDIEGNAASGLSLLSGDDFVLCNINIFLQLKYFAFKSAQVILYKHSLLIKLVNETVKTNVFQLLTHSSRLITIKAFLKYN